MSSAQTSEPVPPPASTALHDSGALYDVATSIRKFLESSKSLNEDGTRAFFINKWLDALGYSSFNDIDHGTAVASGDFPDYVLRSGGKPVMAVEAKSIGHQLGPKEAAQIAKYGSVLGLRWGLLTDGRCLQVFDIPVTGVAPQDRLVLSIDLADFADREDFDTRIWPAASLLTKNAMADGVGLERHAARELVKTVLMDPASPTTAALKKDPSEPQSDALGTRDREPRCGTSRIKDRASIVDDDYRPVNPVVQLCL